MGLYQSLDYMEINGLLDGFSMTEEGIVALPVVTYIYRITFNPTGHFYIGQTHRLKHRFYEHIQGITACAGPYDIPKMAQPFHRAVGPLLATAHQVLDTGRKKKPSLEIFCRQSCSAYIYSICGDLETSNLVEQHYISKERRNILCMNIQNR